ncbi:phosphoglycolate phosphatase [Vreelandella rituensis]|uniref:Phosphoglycolate phosphatase n=1 Tax=Vreelandella rituensis TaxID=2282306 RepID=A0A368TU11_9GAMM|nr:phosphoglycolate phosphatase [Halomonas rituensis]RCV87542.1 phosphoglycolate phosphatase [Halomonas rituensis]
MHPILDDKRLLAFDLDGTLVDSVPDLAVAVSKALREQALPEPGEGEVRDWVGNGSWVLMERALNWAMGETPTPGQCEQGHRDFLYHYGLAPFARTRLYPGVKTTLDALARLPLHLVLVTNKPERFIEPILAHFGLAEHFSLCLGGDSLPRKKPDPLPLTHCAEHFGILPAQSLMIGDSRHDIAAGKAAGFATLAVPYGYNHGQPIRLSEPDVVLDSLEQLLSPVPHATRTA